MESTNFNRTKNNIPPKNTIYTKLHSYFVWRPLMWKQEKDKLKKKENKKYDGKAYGFLKIPATPITNIGTEIEKIIKLGKLNNSPSIKWLIKYRIM